MEDEEWAVAGRRRKPKSQQPQDGTTARKPTAAAKPPPRGGRMQAAAEELPGWGEPGPGASTPVDAGVWAAWPQAHEASTAAAPASVAGAGFSAAGFPLGHSSSSSSNSHACCASSSGGLAASIAAAGAGVGAEAGPAPLGEAGAWATQPPGRANGRARGRGKGGDSMEERLQRLESSVQACRAEVQACPTYQHLLAAMTSAQLHLSRCLGAGGTTPRAADSSTAPGGTTSCPAVQPHETGSTEPVAPNISVNATHALGERPESDQSVPPVPGNSLTSDSAPSPGHTPAPHWPPPSPWWAVQQLVVYGLGSVEDSRTSRYQLALALLLRDLLPGLTSPPLVFDPAFSAADAALMQRMGLSIMTLNEQGRRQALLPTLFYMPHCEHLLYEALLSSNRFSGCLPNVCLLGNSLQHYEEAWSSKPKDKPARPHTLLELVQSGGVQELAVACERAPDPGAFNNMALHLFTPLAATLS